MDQANPAVWWAIFLLSMHVNGNDDVRNIILVQEAKLFKRNLISWTELLIQTHSKFNCIPLQSSIIVSHYYRIKGGGARVEYSDQLWKYFNYLEDVFLIIVDIILCLRASWLTYAFRVLFVSFSYKSNTSATKRWRKIPFKSTAPNISKSISSTYNFLFKYFSYYQISNKISLISIN